MNDWKDWVDSQWSRLDRLDVGNAIVTIIGLVILLSLVIKWE